MVCIGLSCKLKLMCIFLEIGHVGMSSAKHTNIMI